MSSRFDTDEEEDSPVADVMLQESAVNSLTPLASTFLPEPAITSATSSATSLATSLATTSASTTSNTPVFPSGTFHVKSDRSFQAQPFRSATFPKGVPISEPLVCPKPPIFSSPSLDLQPTPSFATNSFSSFEKEKRSLDTHTKKDKRRHSDPKLASARHHLRLLQDQLQSVENTIDAMEARFTGTQSELVQYGSNYEHLAEALFYMTKFCTSVHLVKTKHAASKANPFGFVVVVACIVCCMGIMYYIPEWYVLLRKI